ncbi:MAG: PAS domain-containing sensor histidine kinase, partial [Bacteroidota bacterium]
ALAITSIGDSKRFTMVPFEQNDALVHGELLLSGDSNNQTWVLHLSQGSPERWESDDVEGYAENSSTLIYVYDIIEQKNVFSNKDVSELLGFTTEEFRNISGGVLSLIHPNDLKGLGSHQKKLLASEKNVPYYFEYAIKHKDGHYVSLGSWDRPYTRNSQGQVVQYLGVTFELETARFPSSTAVDDGQIRPDVEWFAQMVAHDLKQPLHHIHGLAKLISRHLDKGSTEQTQGLLDMLIKSADDAQNLVNSMLQMSYANKDKLDKTNLDMAALMEEVMGMELGVEKPEGTELEVQEHMPAINVNRSLFKQVLTNIVSNSLKFKKEGVPLLIKMSYQREGKYHQIAIEDNGVGISPGQDSDIFALFNKSVTHNKSGYGIGLSIVKRVVARHGGNVKMEPVTPHGIKIVMNLPA